MPDITYFEKVNKIAYTLDAAHRNDNNLQKTEQTKI